MRGLYWPAWVLVQVDRPASRRLTCGRSVVADCPQIDNPVRQLV